jgi:hypothetical protein
MLDHDARAQQIVSVIGLDEALSRSLPSQMSEHLRHESIA